MATQYKLDGAYMRMAHELARLSTAQRAKVGALIVRDTHILSEGYNGTPVGFSNDCEYYDHGDQFCTKRVVIHAESNAITKLAKSTSSSDGATLYVTLAPCFDCAKLIVQAGIKRVVYEKKYNEDGLDLLYKAGVNYTRTSTKEVIHETTH